MSTRLVCYLFSFLILLLNPGPTESLYKFTNAKCSCYDENYCTFKACELKVLGRGMIGLNLYVQMLQFPLGNLGTSLTMYRKFNGYRPFLYNISLDFCDYLKYRNRYPVFRWFHSTFENNSNINHTCPYDHDFAVSKLVLNDKMLELMPLPTGSYMFKIMAIANYIPRAMVNVYVDVIELGT